MLMLRLQRVGRKHNPYFRVVVTDRQNSTKSGRFLEVIGSYDARKGLRVINADRAKHWLSKGAKPTVTIHNMLVDKKVISGKKLSAVRFPKKEVAPAEPVVAEEKTPAVSEEVAPAEQPAETPVENTPETA